MFGNDLATQPDFPAEIRAPAGTIAGVSAFQVHISDHDIVTAGDSPNVLVAMNPAALKANLNELPAGSTLLINVDTFEERNLAKAGYAENPLHDDSLAGVPGLRSPDDVDHGRGDQAARREAARRRALQELLRARPHLLDVHPADRSADRLDQEALREPARGLRGERRRVPGRLQLRRDGRALRPRVRGQARAARAGGVPPDHRQRRPVVRARRRGAGREAPALLRVVPDHPGLRHPARALEAQELRREDAAGRRRDLRGRHRDRRRVRRATSRSRARAARASTSSPRRSGSR